jgi:hypothetical protein
MSFTADQKDFKSRAATVPTVALIAPDLSDSEGCPGSGTKRLSDHCRVYAAFKS